MISLNPQLAEVLLPAYSPCANFCGVCQSMRWCPSQGHVPRGFCGATGRLEEIKLVLVCAEPGDPHERENHESTGLPSDQLKSAYAHAYDCFKNGKDLFHRNIRHILDMCLPNLDFDEQMKMAWITESVLCSADKECGCIPVEITRSCRELYLEKQLQLMPNAVVVALGGKAKKRLAGLPNLLFAHAAAPPGCNKQPAKDSWRAMATQFANKCY